MYWTNWQDPVRIERMKTDNTGEREVVINATVPENIPPEEDPWMLAPYGLALDYDGIFTFAFLHFSTLSFRIVFAYKTDI